MSTQEAPAAACRPVQIVPGKIFLAIALAAILLTASLGITAPAAAADPLVVYSGRAEPLVGPLFQRFTELTGIQVNVRYGNTAELAATILEEGRNTPADVFFAQDAGALGALAAHNRLKVLPAELLEKVPAGARSASGHWVGASGRARVVAYNIDRLSPSDLPDSIWGFTEPAWRGRLGWAPTNASFQAFVTALRVLEGDDRAREWLLAVKANEPRVYRNNTLIVDAVGRGEIDAGFVNHYYLFRFLAERGESFPVRHHHTRSDAGALVNVAGAGILDTSKNDEAALAFIEFLLSEETQRYFASSTYEYPLAHTDVIELHPFVVPLDEIDAPQIALDSLEDLEGTLEMLLETGVL